MTLMGRLLHQCRFSARLGYIQTSEASQIPYSRVLENLPVFASFLSLAGSYCLCFGLLGLHRALVGHGSLLSRQPVSKKSGLCEDPSQTRLIYRREVSFQYCRKGKELMDLQVARMTPCHDCRPSSARPARCFRRGSGCSVCSACAQSKNIYITGRGVDPSLA